MYPDEVLAVTLEFNLREQLKESQNISECKEVCEYKIVKRTTNVIHIAYINYFALP